MTLDEIKDSKLIALDTAPLIYYVENHPAFIAVMNAVVDLIDKMNRLRLLPL